MSETFLDVRGFLSITLSVIRIPKELADFCHRESSFGKGKHWRLTVHWYGRYLGHQQALLDLASLRAAMNGPDATCHGHHVEVLDPTHAFILWYCSDRT